MTKPIEESQGFNPETHIRGDDGQIYEKTYIHAVGQAAGAHVDGVEKSEQNLAIQRAMAEAVHQANAEGKLLDADHVRDRMHAARDQVLGNG
jgi:hypothetical protein